MTDILTGGRGPALSAGGTTALSTDACCPKDCSGARDCLRQTVVDLMQLAHIVTGTTSMATKRRSRSSRIYFAGHSFGSTYGTMLTAVRA